MSQIGFHIDNYMSKEKQEYSYLPNCWVGGVWYTARQSWENHMLILESEELLQLGSNPEISEVCGDKYLAVLYVDDFIARMKNGEIE